MRYRYLLIVLGSVLAACAPANLQPTITSPVQPAFTSPVSTGLPSPVTAAPLALTAGTCLPPGIELSSVVSAQATGGKVSKVTVQQTLDQLGAACQNGLLVDSSGKEIYFYPLKGCWGNPPDNYQDILQKQRDELEKLKTQYNVIELTCNPSGLPIQ